MSETRDVLFSGTFCAATLLLLTFIFAAGALFCLVLVRRYPDPPQYRIRAGESQVDIARRVRRLG